MRRKYDCIVVGGGFSGVCAAIAAARSNLKVLIVEKANCFGGTATLSLVEPFMPVNTLIDGQMVMLCQGLLKEITERLMQRCDYNSEFNYNIIDDYKSAEILDDEYLKLILNRMLIEAGAEILFHSYLIDANVKNNRIESIIVANKSGKIELEADYFIDATGDADLAHLSGCSYRLGRDEDNLCQPMTMCFRLGNVDKVKFKNDEQRMNELYREFKKNGKIKNPKEHDIQIFFNSVENVLHFNSTKVLKHNPTDVFELTKAEIEAREQVYELYDFMRNNIDGCQNSQLIKTATMIGIRESRMINGEYILTSEDLVGLKQFEDTVVVANYDLDLHDPTSGNVSHHFFNEGEYYTIPYRSLIPKELDNLAVAGRCISVTHEAQAAIRIMPIVCCIGEAAGVAAGVAKESGASFKTAEIKEIQRRLVERGAFLNI